MRKQVEDALRELPSDGALGGRKIEIAVAVTAEALRRGLRAR